MPDTHLKLFGSPVLERNGRSHHLPRRKARALLAYLAVNPQSHSRESLVALLWPEHTTSEGRADLSRTLSLLRKKLGAKAILADRETVQLNPQAELRVNVLEQALS